MSAMPVVVVVVVGVVLLLLVIGLVIAAVVRNKQADPVEHRPLDPSVIQCFPPGHPREGEPIPQGEATPSAFPRSGTTPGPDGTVA